MRRFLVLVFSFFAVATSICAQMVSPFSYPLTTVIIDPGHGGQDPGARGNVNGSIITEKEVTLSLAQALREQLIAKDPSLTIILTRETDIFVSLETRASYARYTNPGTYGSSLLVSLHANAVASLDPQGFEILIKKTEKQVYFLTEHSPDWQIARYATYTNSSLNQMLNRSNLLFASFLSDALTEAFPEARNRGIKEQDLWVLNASAVPSAVVEVGFLSNPQEGLRMQEASWIEAMAAAIAQGIIAYLNYSIPP